MMSTTTMIPCRYFSQRKLAIGTYIGRALANQIITEKASSEQETLNNVQNYTLGS